MIMQAEVVEIELELPDWFPQWYQCPECGHDGVKSDLENFGHSCCKKYIKELEYGGIEYERDDSTELV
jgi:hypothetical protein